MYGEGEACDEKTIDPYCDWCREICNSFCLTNDLPLFGPRQQPVLALKVSTSPGSVVIGQTEHVISLISPQRDN